MSSGSFLVAAGGIAKLPGKSRRTRTLHGAASEHRRASSPGWNEKFSSGPASSPSSAGIGFSVRGVSILEAWGNQYGFTQAELGNITGGGLIGFGLAIIFFSFFADKFGYGKLMVVAFLLHASSAVVTFAATPVFNQYGKDGAYYREPGHVAVRAGQRDVRGGHQPADGDAVSEEQDALAEHPARRLAAGAHPRGGLIGLGFEKFGAGVPWEYQLGIFLIPVLIYGLMMVGRRFPHSEARRLASRCPR